MKFRIIEAQCEIFQFASCAMSWPSLRRGIMLGAAGRKARERRPIALCSPRSGASIWHIVDAMAGRESTRPCAAWGTRRAVAGSSASCAITVSGQ